MIICQNYMMRRQLDRYLEQSIYLLDYIEPIVFGTPHIYNQLKIHIFPSPSILIINHQSTKILFKFSEDRLIHLDPHYCQEMVDVNQENFPLHSFHCKSPRKLKTSKMDPSCSIGFYCQTRSDFDNFIKSVELVSL